MSNEAAKDKPDPVVSCSSSSSPSSSAGAAGAIPPSSSAAKNPAVKVDVDANDDEEVQILEATKRSIKEIYANGSGSASKKPKTCSEDNDAIIILDSDSEGTLDLCGDDDDDDDDEVMVVEPVAAAAAASSEDANANEGADDDLVVVGEKNVMRLPHMRQHCTKFKFVQDVRSKAANTWSTLGRQILNEGKVGNPKTCDLCYCFICDKPVSECKNWSSKSFNDNDHCHASDKGLDSAYYKNLRDKIKRGVVVTPSTSATASTPSIDELPTSQTSHEFPNNIQTYSQHSIYRGPFKPDDVNAKRLKGHCTKCRRCGWYYKYDHNNFSKIIGVDENGIRTRKTNMTGVQDFCKACSRVVSHEDFEKEQSKEYKPTVGVISLGRRRISFKLKARDPRKCESTKKFWDEFEGTSSNWEYNEADMEEDFFRHRIGRRPLLRHVLNAIPLVKPDSIPESSSSEVSQTETEALILENQNDLSILRELERFDKNWGLNDANLGGATPLEMNISADWNTAKRSGIIEIQVYLNRFAFVGNANLLRQRNRQAMFSRLLGCWYSIDRFKLSDLTSGMSAKRLSSDEKRNLLRRGTGLIPATLNREEMQNIKNDIVDEDILNAYNNEAKTISKKLSFKSSSSSDDCGITASSDTSFEGTLKRIAESSLVDDHRFMQSSGPNTLGNTSAATKLGIVSTHRSMRAKNRNQNRNQTETLRDFRPYGTDGIDSYLDPKEHILLQNLSPKFLKIRSRCETMNGLLQQLENVGHAPADQPDGLNVELFDFQRQAVGWALEREQEGGFERFLWTKLPPGSSEVVNNSRQVPVELYYSPILDQFSKEKPKDTRGGLIAAQMGLGKTVISLSLILLNPAPENPISGTAVKDYNLPATFTSTNQNIAPWPLPEPLPKDAPKKRGSIFSRGTLVVCNVSLVGQWIDEAKSKLKDPGLVYSYHGSSRKRDPMILAKNAVVVTTYATLASDANFHANKSTDPNYCAPCEQVRWWRIICDESHSVRDTNTKNHKALSRLTAVNKWAVTGTPMNTTPTDLRGQLSFIGLSYMSKMFSLFASSMQGVFKTSKRRRRNSWRLSSNESIGPFLFLMRNVMIRHAISQCSRDTKVGIMTLPPKEEKVIEVEFNTAERKEYDRIQKKAASMYEQLKSRGNVNRHYLRLNSALLPLRVACSGGNLDEGQINRKHEPKENLTGDELQYDLETSQECSICLDAVEDPHATACKPVPHIFCKECIEGVFSGAATIQCPFCRTVVKADDLRTVVPKVKSNEDETKEKESSPNTKKPSKKKQDKILKDSDILFRSKFETLLKELKRIRDDEPGSKSLVFSQFTSTLQWMKQELPKHGFQFRTLSGNMSMKKRADALREFQSDPPTAIFLLSMRSGAVGINLTQANRVFMMEPAMNPALEAQAVGRVYRLGQRKPVQVIKLRMKDSFESRLVKVLKRKFNDVTKPPPSESSGDEEKKSDGTNPSNADQNEKKIDSKDGRELPIETSQVVATLGHMNRDKADLMTEEFDALFGLTEPEDLPDKIPSAPTRSDSPPQGSDSDNESSTSSIQLSPLYNGDVGLFGRRVISCACGNCSDNEGDDDERDDDERDECTIS